MVNSGLTNGNGLPIDPEVTLAIAYAPAAARSGLEALFGFDRRLAAILATTTEPMIGQMRLTWWHDAVARASEIAGEPVLGALSVTGADPAALQRIVTGWEALLDGDDDDAMAAYADARGGGLFAAAAEVLGADDPVAAAGAGWALVDLARHHSRSEVAGKALAMARGQLADAPVRWSGAGRPLGVLTKLARRDLAGIEPQGSPRRIAAALALRLTGR